MKFLLDTHLLLWASFSPEKLSMSARKLLTPPTSQLFFSAANIWEISIKKSLLRKDFDVDAHSLRRSLLDNDYAEIPITGDHALALELLPPIHKDPFDRILIAQSITEGITLLTVDPVLSKYPGPIRQV
jgi:PIN domain nuclease of toxin-antitoxin system